MDFETFKISVSEFVKTHQGIAPFVVAALAFGESLAIISLFIPATIILIGIGFLVGDGTLAFFPVWLGAAVGAYLGDTASYLVGFYFKKRIFRIWPLYLFPRMVMKGRRFFKRWGVVSVFIGRFFGPVRAVVPLIAGVFEMPWKIFQASNIMSAMFWSFGLLAPGMGLIKLFGWLEMM